MFKYFSELFEDIYIYIQNIVLMILQYVRQDSILESVFGYLEVLGQGRVDIDLQITFIIENFCKQRNRNVLNNIKIM